ncbi:hypothetical protein [Klebsiella aerogenes]|uniref:hypothetical protein n=1 Tax=Klebsiella aerogenes TaxID=548 RepID=UPI00227974DF|nr:hypothetical protein [Klebsiella aerogenes]MCY4762936.1 hypothetical protein [Klebsiella aerogenes]
MTNNQLTKEWLQQTIAELESVRDEIPFGIDINSELELAAFKMALAAMDSEPVAYTDERNLGYIDRGRETAYLWGKQNSEASDVALYRHAQPAPVEVRNKLKAEALADLLKDAREYAPLTAEQWELLANNWHQTFVGLSGEGDTCRAAMLHGVSAELKEYRKATRR